ncbi:MAG: hypothetical protein KDA68_15275, partial [Planctomycetaceae bacterium]|nr:hypothetical protein [Planctomycetaceae bacterium]
RLPHLEPTSSHPRPHRAPISTSPPPRADRVSSPHFPRKEQKNRGVNSIDSPAMNPPTSNGINSRRKVSTTVEQFDPIFYGTSFNSIRKTRSYGFAYQP